MIKRIIASVLSASVLFSMCAVTAEENEEKSDTQKLYCLSDNNWQGGEASRDVALYKEMGIELENYKTGAVYEWTKDSDDELKRNDSVNHISETKENYKGTEMTSGSISDPSGNAVTNSTWQKGKNHATAVFDLKASYWVSKVDAWSYSTKSAQVSSVSVRVGESLDNMKELPSAKAKIPTVEQLEKESQFLSYATVEFPAGKARYVEVTYNVEPDSETLSGIWQMIPAEIAVFGYLEKPVSEEIVEETVAEPTVIHSAKDPVIDERNEYITDLGAVYEVTKTAVTQYNSPVNGLENYDVYLSSDGKNFMYIGSGESVNKVEHTVNTVNYDITQKMYARYVKLVMNKAEGREGVLVRNIEIYGRDGIEEQRIDTNAEYSYYTQNPYRTADDIILQDEECKILTDGDTETTIRTTEKWATVVMDLKEPYQIGNVDIYSLAKGNSFMEGCEIRYSLDGKKFFTYTYYLNDNEKTGGIVKSSFSGMPGRNARYLKIIMQGSTRNMAISEIAVNGYPVKAARSLVPKKVPLRVEMKNYLLAYLDWSTFNGDNASKVSVYVEKNPYTNTKDLVPIATYERFDDQYINKYTTKTNLEPETTYYFAVTPYDDEGNEYTEVTPVKITTQGVLGTKVRDTFNITNHPNYNGGATKKFGTYTETMKKEAVRLMDEMGASNKNRLWELSAANNQMYTDIGISTFLISPTLTTSKEYGNYMYSNGNESDLHKADVNDFLNGMKSAYKSLKNADHRNLLCDPVLGGTEVGSLQWFDSLYKAGNGIETKLNYDVVDVHFYCKSVDEQIPGLPLAVPELLFKKIANVREVMERYDDGDKPIISTETGFHTSDVNGYQPKVDYETQRDYIVRMYMIMIANGIREVWYYNFHDDGADLNYHEHNWGLIDYFGVPKPGYYGYYNMYQQMRFAEYDGAISGLANPYYGYEFFDRMKSKKISVIWAADGQSKTLQFETMSGQDEKIEVIGTDGSFNVINTENNKGSVSIGRAPIFIYSDNGIKPNSINVAFAAEDSELETIRGKDVTFTLARKTLGKNTAGRVEAVGLPSGWSIVSGTEFNATQEKIDVVVNIPESASEEKHEFKFNVVMDNGGVSPINVSVDVKSSISVSITPQPVEFGKWDSWRLEAKCTNVVDVPVSGKISALGASGITITTLEALEINDLQPGETRIIYFNVDKPATEFGAVGTFMIEVNGQRKNFDRTLNFSACVNDGITPVMDGVISEGEWDNCHVITNDAYRHGKWLGESDLGFKVYRKWDNENFYMAVDVTDDVHCQPYTGSDVWQGDNIQFSIDPARKDGVGIQNTDYFELGLSRNDDNELMTWAWLADLVVKKERTIGSYKGAVNRTDDNHTIYEITIPWGYFIETGIVNENDCIGFSIALNDNDGTGRKGYLMYMRGITDKKQADNFEDMVLIKK